MFRSKLARYASIGFFSIVSVFRFTYWNYHLAKENKINNNQQQSYSDPKNARETMLTINSDKEILAGEINFNENGKYDYDFSDIVECFEAYLDVIYGQDDDLLGIVQSPSIKFSSGSDYMTRIKRKTENAIERGLATNENIHSLVDFSAIVEGVYTGERLTK